MLRLRLVLVAAWCAACAVATKNETLQWGTYRPGVYFGLRSRARDSPVVGLMWAQAHALSKIRHRCEESDNLQYGWQAHDGALYGTQQLTDPEYGVTLETTFAKDEGSPDWWAFRVRARKTGASGRALSLFLYAGVPPSAGPLQLSSSPKKGITGDVSITGTSGNRDFELVVHAPENFVKQSPRLKGKLKNLPALDKTHFAGFHMASDGWDIQQSVESQLQQNFFKAYNELMPSLTGATHEEASSVLGSVVPTLQDTLQPQSNVLVLQLVLPLPFEVDVTFGPPTFDDEEDEGGLDDGMPLLERKSDEGGARAQWLGEALTRSFATRQRAFDERFRAVYASLSAADAALGKAALCNLLGGIGYFYGRSLVHDDSVPNNSTFFAPPKALFTAVPSRSFFPRGFLWDEGFHQLVIASWDLDLSVEMLRHWFDLMTDDGWIPREQILGDEAVSRVESWFRYGTFLIARHSERCLPSSECSTRALRTRRRCSSRYTSSWTKCHATACLLKINHSTANIFCR
eukprot:TRINITY_DN3537_c0_g1_i2.p1 TRINITY_DN3537_c0_g1~~TRINITY_DN3537_c0_g1_i2.p1  ORF type:complete len:517 (+),score=85.16 TRINITY_DN3537_c0_g1_i2:3-1553(+)